MDTNFAQMRLCEYADRLASAAPTPGGGGTAALAGALGAALGNMVGALTLGKAKYAGVQDDIARLGRRCAEIQSELLAQVEADARGFEPLVRAYAMDRDDPARAAALERASLVACESPLAVMRLCGEALDLLAAYAEKGSRLAISDAGCGAALCRAACESAALNVFINTRTLADRARAAEINARVTAALARDAALAERIIASVSRALTGGEARP